MPGGGTYQVIEALRDRIDIVVKALHFNSRFLGELLERIEQGVRPEEVVPPQVVFDEDELDRLHKESLAVAVPAPILRRLEFFASQFEFCDRAASQLEYKTKDTAKLSGIDWRQLAAMETGKDKRKDIGSQTRNGLSVRSLMTVLVFVKAMAFFRGSREVTIEDVRQIVPFVLHDKLTQDARLPLLRGPGERRLPHRQDRLDPQALRPVLCRIRPPGPGSRRPCRRRLPRNSTRAWRASARSRFAPSW